MNILFVHDHILRKIGGDYYSTGGLSCDVLRRYFVGRNDKMVLITRCKRVKKTERDKLVKINCPRIICRPSKIYDGPKNLLKSRLIKRAELLPAINLADLIIVRLPSFLGFMAYSVAKRENKNVLVEVVACPLDSFSYHGGFLSRLAAPIMYLLTKKACWGAKNVLYVTESFLQKRYPTKGRSVACSDVDIPDLDDSVIECRMRKIGAEKKVYKIGIMGSLDVDFKGHREAILAMKDLIEKGFNVELHCLGSGSSKRWRKIAKKYGVSEKVFFDGTLPAGEEVRCWLDSLDIFIIPSLQDGLPRGLVEAMSRGCPVVGMRTGGIPELIDSELLCRKKDYRKLAENIEIIINNPAYAKRIAKNNFNRAKDFTFSKLKHKRNNFLRSVVKDCHG